MPKLSVNVAPEVSTAIAARADAAGQAKSDWIEALIVDALSGEKQGGQGAPGPAVNDEEDQLLAALRHRIDQLEMRFLHEHDAILHHLKVVHRHAMHARLAAVTSALSTRFLDQKEVSAEREALQRMAEAAFERDFDRTLPVLKEIRSEGEDSAHGMPIGSEERPTNGAGGEG
ncbi:MAG: hypothetical protein OEU92_15255 [Alphaproteobacteria bacterium]|nr:hypothetical protein [Alphaproteobacteria bacterium]